MKTIDSINNMEDFMLITTINQPKSAVKKCTHCFIHVWVRGCRVCIPVYACVWVG